MSTDLHGVLRAPHEGLHGACKAARPLGDHAAYAQTTAEITCTECIKLGASGWAPPKPKDPEPAPAKGEEHAS